MGIDTVMSEMYISERRRSSVMRKDMSTVELRENLSEAVNRAAFGKERVVLTRRGRKLAGIVPYEDIELLEALEDKKDIADAKKALKEAAKKGTVSLQQLKKELGL
jgi:prevent-host-death family protein